MEQTFGHSARADEEPLRRKPPRASRSPTLGALLRAWSDRGQALPVAIVVSIFDDLLEHAVSTQARGREIVLDDVDLEPSGFSRLSHASARVSAMSLAPLLARALGEGLDEGAVPPAALALLGRLAAQASEDSALDPEQLRCWMREALGAPASREEMSAWVGAVALEAKSERESTRPDSSIIESAVDPVALDGSAEAAAIVEPYPMPDDEDEEREAADARRVESIEVSSDRDLAVEGAFADTEEGSISRTGGSDPPLITIPPDEFVEVAREPSELPTEPPHPSDLQPSNDLPALRSAEASADLPALRPPEPSADLPAFRSPKPSADLPAFRSPEPSADLPALRSSEPSSDLPVPASEPSSDLPSPSRPVVRHQWRPTTGGVPRAPAARRSARPTLDARDMLAIPGERNPWLTWLIAVFVALAVGFLWFRCG